MKASYYTDPVRGKVYRRSYDTLEEAKAYRDEFYSWYQAEVPAPNAHLIKDGEGFAVETVSSMPWASCGRTSTPAGSAGNPSSQTSTTHGRVRNPFLTPPPAPPVNKPSWTVCTTGCAATPCTPQK